YVSLILCRVRDLLGRILGVCLRPAAKAGRAAGGVIRRLGKRIRTFCKNKLKSYRKLLTIRVKKK
ncbi:MAG: hypothetical protein K2H45_02500, partial [Acetatifactor sp.]|nr:hypothetical protein [Acetatifactor sp.]